MIEMTAAETQEQPTATSGAAWTDPDPSPVVTDSEERVHAEPAVPPFRYRVDPFHRTKDKVAIVGFTDHRKLAFKLGDDFELWGLNELYQYEDVSRFHRWFEIHPRDDFEKDDAGKKHLADMGKLDLPIYMHQHFGDIPASMPFPKKELEVALGSDYFTSTPAWMIGMALAMDFREIHIYGVDMAQDSEYVGQRPCCEYWLGRAEGAGVRIYRPPVSDLLSAIGQYGFENGSAFSAKVQERLRYLHGRDNVILAALRELEAKKESVDVEYKARKDSLFAERMQMVGAIQDCNFWNRSWAVSAAADAASAVPDRSADPQTGIGKAAA
mgnify:CR=1 FL=1